MPRFEIKDGKCVIPYGVTEILEGEFAECKQLKEVVIPDTVVSIGIGAFFWCTSLKEVNIPDSVINLGSQAFEGCSRLKSVRIPEGVKELASTFYQCSSLKEIYIPRSVTSIWHNTFSACTKLEKIEVAEDNPVFKSVNNCCLTKDGKTLLFGCSTSVIPEGVTDIEDFAFYSCTRLRNITIPEGVEYIGNWSFGSCRKLISVNIPKSAKELVLCAFSDTAIKDIFIASDDPNKFSDLIEALRGRRYKDITIHVPEGCAGKFSSHPYFKKFQHIV